MGLPASSAPPQAIVPPKSVERFFQFSLLGMLASGYFAVATSGYLDWPTAIVTFAALCVRALMASNVVKFAFPGRLADVLALSFAAFYPLDYLYFSHAFLPATVHFVFFLLICKVLTARSTRDFTYLKLLAALELIAAAILSTSLSFFAFLALFVLFAIASFASGEVRVSTQKQRSVARGGLRAFPRRLSLLSIFLFIGILGMTSVLFFVLPRTAHAALARFLPERAHLPGFANEVRLGEIGELKQSSTPVMHIRRDQNKDLGEGLLDVRWRGAALTEFDGKKWFNPPGPAVPIAVPSQSHNVTFSIPYDPLRGRPLVYRVQFSEMASETLFFAGTVQSISINAPQLILTRGGGLRVPKASTSGLLYIASSYPEDSRGPGLSTEPLPPIERDELLLLPNNLDARIPLLAREIAGGAGNDAVKSRHIEQYLRRHYGYTLHLLSQSVADPLANFLFDRKKGHCEYFASSMAVMLRTVGIPSRVVTGFASGIYNPLTGWQVVRASDAHSWVEAWIPGRGWTTYDPTPSDPGAVQSMFLTRVSLFFDAADQFWQDWVMSYDLQRQIVLAAKVQQTGRGARQHWMERAIGWLASVGRSRGEWSGGYIPIAAAVIFLAIIGVMTVPSMVRWFRRAMRLRRLKRGEGKASDATLLYQRMLRLLERRGIQKPPWLTPSEFARVMTPDEIAAVVDDLTTAYVEFRFGGKRDAAPRMVQLLDQLEKM